MFFLLGNQPPRTFPQGNRFPLVPHQQTFLHGFTFGRNNFFLFRIGDFRSSLFPNDGIILQGSLKNKSQLSQFFHQRTDFVWIFYKCESISRAFISVKIDLEGSPLYNFDFCLFPLSDIHSLVEHPQNPFSRTTRTKHSSGSKTILEQ